MKWESSGKGTACVNFLLSPPFPPPLEKTGARCSQPAANSCKILPCSARSPLQGKSCPPGLGSRGVKVEGGGVGVCPQPRPPPPASPLPACSPTPGGSRDRRGLLFYLALMLEDQLASPRFYFFPPQSFQSLVLSLIPR